MQTGRAPPLPVMEVEAQVVPFVYSFIELVCVRKVTQIADRPDPV